MPDALPDPDGERMRRWADGDRSAFEEIVRAWEQPVGRFLVRLTRDRDFAGDLTQEVFLRVYLKGAKHYTHGGTFRTWLYQIALNLARDAARRHGRRPQVPLLPSAHPATDSEPAFDTQQQADVVNAALADLPEPLREVVVLRHYEDLSFEAMARMLGVPATTLKSRFAVAMKKLEDVLMPRLGERPA
ncbi:MAG: sigma-70 family RNA polymerase sigma factor [Fimbriiglobus sp.]|jgi:RNA polymerase sigma-70 factor (ECF subfamily)|nr:sigma-70 family RNA polymerase sigma factor [Fimbriiglobus sp.]